MRLNASGFLCGLCLLAAAAGTPVSAGMLSGSADTVSVGQTVVTAQVIAEETPSADCPGQEESAPPGQEPSENEPSDPVLPDALKPGMHAGAVNTADAGIWEYLLLLLVFSGIVIIAVKLRKLYQL